MKNNNYKLAALIAMSHLGAISAFAQSATTTVLPTQDTNSNAASANISALDADAPRAKISYLGIGYGPGMEFSGSRQSTTPNGNDPITLEHRIGLNYQTSKNVSFGLQPRIKTVFTPDDLHMDNGNFRLMGNFKNVIQTDTMSLTVTPRAILPTSKGAHNKDMKVSPELLLTLDYAPKDSRFSFQIGNAYQYYIYGDNANDSTSSADVSNALTAMDQPWAEIDYQVSPKVQAFASYWPEFDAQARQNVPLHAVDNEIDLGAYVEFAKGWQIAPYIATEFQGIDMARMDKAMQFNVLLIGSVL